MAFLLYFVVIVVSVASVMFGIDLASSPLPSTPNVPIGRTAATAVPVAKRADKSRADEKLADKKPAPTIGRAGDKRADFLVAKPKHAEAQPPPKQAANKPWLPPPQNLQAAISPEPDGQQTGNKPDVITPPAVADAAWAQPSAAAQSDPHCDLQACAAAYRSFRSSDCTYQPYQGPRRLCTRIGGADAAQSRQQPRTQAAAAPQVRSSGTDEISRIVRQMTPGEGDVPVRKADGSIVVIHTGGASAQASCDVAACAAAYRSFRTSDCTFQPNRGPRRLCTR